MKAIAAWFGAAVTLSGFVGPVSIFGSIAAYLNEVPIVHSAVRDQEA
jgi:hypothetical protein